MKVVVFEPGHSGHRMHYVSLILSAITELGIRPILATTQRSLESQDYQLHVAQNVENFEIYTLPETLAETTSPWNAKHKFEILKHAFDEMKVDHLLVPTIEQIFPLLLYKQVFRKKFSSPRPFIEGMFFSPGHGYRFENWKRKILNPIIKFFSRRLSIDVYGHADPYQLQNIAREAGKIQYSVMPDPVPKSIRLSKIESRRKLEIPEDGRYISICGGISESKGVHDLVDAFSSVADKILPNDRVLLAGGFSPQTWEYLRHFHQNLLDENRIVCIDRVMGGDDLSLVCKAMDLYCAAQIGRPGSSGTLLRAASEGTPILARDRFWSGLIVKDFRLGWTARTWLKEEFAEALVQCLNEIQSFRFDDTATRYLAFHQESNFKAAWTVHLRKRLGLPLLDSRIAWSDVQKPNSNT